MQPLLDDIDGDDEELAQVPDFDDDFCRCTVEGATLDDVLRFAGTAISLALDDLAREDDVFEIKDGEVVIFKFVRGVGGDGITERSDQLAKVGDGHLGHARVYEGSARPGCWGPADESRGELRAARGDPKAWFTLPEGFAKLLSSRNRALLAQIADTQPASLHELATTSDPGCLARLDER